MRNHRNFCWDDLYTKYSCNNKSYVMEKYGFVYLWYDKKHKKFYVGCRWGKENDGYICSSTWMKQGYKHRPSDFKRRILARVYTNKKDLLEEEYKWLSKIKYEELGKKYYNLHNHHFGHWYAEETNRKTVREKLSEATKRLHKDPIYREKYIEGRKKLPPRSKEAIRKTALANTGKKRTEETKQKISKAHTGKIVGSLSEETKQKLSIALSGDKNSFYGKQHEPELKKEMNKKTSATLKGKMPKNIPTGFWWNNGKINKRTYECPGIEWNRGKL